MSPAFESAQHAMDTGYLAGVLNRLGLLVTPEADDDGASFAPVLRIETPNGLSAVAVRVQVLP